MVDYITKELAGYATYILAISFFLSVGLLFL